MNKANHRVSRESAGSEANVVRAVGLQVHEQVGQSIPLLADSEEGGLEGGTEAQLGSHGANVPELAARAGEDEDSEVGSHSATRWGPREGAVEQDHGLDPSMPQGGQQGGELCAGVDLLAQVVEEPDAPVLRSVRACLHIGRFQPFGLAHLDPQRLQFVAQLFVEALPALVRDVDPFQTANKVLGVAKHHVSSHCGFALFELVQVTLGVEA